MSQTTFHEGRVTLHHGDCLEVLAAMSDCSVDSCVTDPPYGLEFMGRAWDDKDGIAFRPLVWAEVLRVLRPGGHLLAFGGSRTYHRLASAIENAGFEIRDQIMYLYGSGFPKSLNVSEKLKHSLPAHVQCACDPDLMQTTQDYQSDCLFCNDRGDEQPLDVQGNDQDVSPLQDGAQERNHDDRNKDALVKGHEYNHLKENGPPANGGCQTLQQHLEEDCQVHDSGPYDMPSNTLNVSQKVAHKKEIDKRDTQHSNDDLAFGKLRISDVNLPRCALCGKLRIPLGRGTALKPAHEPIVLARKPLAEGTVAANVLRWGCGAINVDGCRVEATDNVTFDRSVGCRSREQYRTGTCVGGAQPSALGRFPANLIHDGSPEVLAGFPQSKGQLAKASTSDTQRAWQNVYGNMVRGSNGQEPRGDEGSAARFFYTAKASKHDRVGSNHPTVKPVDLMRYLCRLITPPGGVVFDPFAGSGTTGQAALEEGFDAVLVEREDEYVADIATRMGLVDLTQPKKERKNMRAATIYEAFDGKQFPSREECAKYEADHAESRLVGLTAEQVRAALSYEDADLAAVIEKMGNICAAARRAAGDLKRRRNGTADVAGATPAVE